MGERTICSTLKRGELYSTPDGSVHLFFWDLIYGDFLGHLLQWLTCTFRRFFLSDQTIFFAAI